MMEWIVTSTVLAALVIAVRYALRGKIGLRLQYGLWLLVLLRLLIPVSFGGAAVSVANVAAPTRPLGQLSRTVVTYVGGETPDLAISEPDPSLPEAEQKAQYEENKAQWQAEMDAYRAATGGTPVSVGDVLLGIWIGGGVVLAGILLVSNLRFGRVLRRSRTPFAVDGVKLPVYVTAAVDTPCLYGLFRPVIYVTPEAAANPSALAFALAHEETHYRHRDHIWAALRCAALVLHWYNPLIWWAALLSRRDGELACDEATVARLGEESRAAYGRTLIDLTCQKPQQLLVTATTMTGSAGGLKERVRLLVKRPRTTVGIALVVLLVAAIAVGCTFTGAEKPAAEPSDTAEEPDTVPDTQPEPAEDTAPTEDTPEPVTAEEAAREWAEEIVAEARAYYADIGDSDLEDHSGDFTVTGARISNLEEIPLQPAAADRGLHLYLLEYRITPDDPAALERYGGLEVVDGEITERDYQGQPYLLLWENGGTVERLARLTTNTLAVNYSPEGLAERYGDSYTGAAVLVLDGALGYEKAADLPQETLAELTSDLQENKVLAAYLPNYGAGTSYEATVTFGAGWLDSEDRAHLEFRASCVYPSVLMEVIMDQQDGQWRLLAVQEVPGQWVSGTPEDIDLSALFYSGCADGGYTNAAWTNPSQAEITEVMGYEVHIDCSKVTTAEADACLRQYMGLGLEETWQYLLKDYTYSEKYDAYYHVHGDTNLTFGMLQSGWNMPDGSVRLRYGRSGGQTDLLNEVALTPDGQGGWHFVYNLPVMEVTES